jgi:DNA polymerase I
MELCGGVPKSSSKKPPPAPSPDVVLFDTYSVLFRAFHALPRMSTSQGVPTSALYGFSALVLKVLREQRPRTLAFAVDAPKRTFRHERYDGYKAGRAKAPSDLVVQLERLPELLDAFGVPVFCMPGFEADDVLATLAHRLSDLNERVLIVSGDRDMLQLVSERTQVLFMGARGRDATCFDVQKVQERFGLSPEKLPSWAALAGDASDNLQGAPGVGPRTATSLVAEHGSVVELLAHLDRVDSPKLRQALAEAADRLRMNEELARLRHDLSLGPGPFSGSLTAEALVRLRAMFEELEFKSLLARLERLTL